MYIQINMEDKQPEFITYSDKLSEYVINYKKEELLKLGMGYFYSTSGWRFYLINDKDGNITVKELREIMIQLNTIFRDVLEEYKRINCLLGVNK